MDAFDSDVLIFAASPAHPLGRRVRRLFEVPLREGSTPFVGVGSVLLVPEVLTRPFRSGSAELGELQVLLSRLDLLAVDEAVASLATVLGASYGLRTPDAVHLATAVNVGADRFITNNSKDFPTTISEIDVTYPSMLPDPDG